MNEKLKNLVVIFLLIFFYPLGLLLAFTWVSWPKWAKNLALLPIYLAILGMLLALILGFIAPKKQMQQAEEARRQTPQKLLTPETKKLMDAQIQSDIELVRSALELYKSDRQKYPRNLEALVPEYLAVLPINPVTGKDYLYKLAQDGNYSI